MWLLAHQGGWDEALFVALPLLGIVGLLWLARRRVDRNLAAGRPTPGAPRAPGVAPEAGPRPKVGEAAAPEPPPPSAVP